jgi:hypothetical protein
MAAETNDLDWSQLYWDRRRAGLGESHEVRVRFTATVSYTDRAYPQLPAERPCTPQELEIEQRWLAARQQDIEAHLHHLLRGNAYKLQVELHGVSEAED